MAEERESERGRTIGWHFTKENSDGMMGREETCKGRVFMPLLINGRVFMPPWLR